MTDHILPHDHTLKPVEHFLNAIEGYQYEKVLFSTDGIETLATMIYESTYEDLELSKQQISGMAGAIISMAKAIATDAESSHDRAEAMKKILATLEEQACE